MVPVYLTQRYLRNKKIMSANYFVPSDYHLKYLASLKPEMAYKKGENDPIFPIAGVRKAFRQTKKIYKAFKAENRLHLLVGKGGHRFYQNLAWPVIKKHL